MEVSAPFDEKSPARAIIDNAPVPIWISGPDGSGIVFNKAWRGVPYMFISGYDLETALPAALRMAPKLQTPATGTQLLAAVRTLIGATADRNGSMGNVQ